MRKILSLLVLIIIVNRSYAQLLPYQMNLKINFVNVDTNYFFKAQSIIIDSYGNRYILGSNYVIGSPTPLEDYDSNKVDCIVYKYDKNFKLIWRKRYGGTRCDLGYFIKFIPGTDKLLVAGKTGSHDGDMPYTFVNPPEYTCGDIQPFFGIIDTSGKLLKMNKFGRLGHVSAMNALSFGMNKFGQIFMYILSTDAGSDDFQGPPNFIEGAVLAMVDTTLKLKWVKYIQGITLASMDCKPNGNVIMQMVDYDQTTLPPALGGPDILLMEVDTLGKEVRYKKFGGVEDDSGYETMAYSDNEIYVSLRVKSRVNNLNYTPLATEEGEDKNNGSLGVIVKLDSNFNVTWHHSVAFLDNSTEIIQSFRADQAIVFYIDTDYIYLVRTIEGWDRTAIGDYYKRQFQFLDSSLTNTVWRYDSDVLVTKIDHQGNLIGSGRFGDFYSESVFGKSTIYKNPISNKIEFYCRSSTSKTSDSYRKFSDCKYPENISTNPHVNYILEIDNTPLSTTTLNKTKVGMSIKPNPVMGKLQVDLSLQSSGVIVIYNMAGQQLSSQAISNKNSVTIDVSNYRPGSYIINYNDSDGVESCSQKFIKE